MIEDYEQAPGRPGIDPKWTSSDKSGVGTALNRISRVWFTIGHGILNEIYYPRIDQACTRDLGFLVLGDDGYFSEEKRDAAHEVSRPDPRAPCYRLMNTGPDRRYRIEKQVLADPRRDVILQQVHFEAQGGDLDAFRLFVLLAPHLGNRGAGNSAWIDDYKGTPMLFAERAGHALALASTAPWRARSAGYVGFSDGWQDLTQHHDLPGIYRRAEDGNVALTGEVDLAAGNGIFTLALAFGRTAAEAGNRALASLQDGFDAAHSRYLAEWQAWQQDLLDLRADREKDLYRTSTIVLRTHEAKRFPGGLIASLSIPWGFTRGDDDLGGYHLAWPRDLVETAGGLLAAGAKKDALRALHYLQTTQEAGGHWTQNMWLDGTPYWNGVQMDETAFPILLADLAHRQGALDERERKRLWPMIRRAAAFLVQNGPVTAQDRWEEDPGYSPFTLAVEIAGLLAAADHADGQGHPDEAAYLRETADFWNSRIEAWTYATDTDLARQLGVEGYYVRIAPPETSDAASPLVGFVPIKNRPPDQSVEPAVHLVSPDALALVRFGLRAPDDPRIRNTVAVIDALLKVETPFGPCWHRYNDDGYGEHDDGDPFDGTGRGRAWPLLTGERAHYELAAGRADEAARLLKTLEAFASDGGMIPEQVWDSADVPERGLFFGRPGGSAMPLVWAHAEYVKLLRSLHDGRVFDLPPQSARRYLEQGQDSPFAVWRFNHKCRTMPPQKTLRIETRSPATVRWSTDGWKSVRNTPTRDTGLGMHVADLPAADLAPGASVRFTFYWTAPDRWEGADFEVTVA